MSSFKNSYIHPIKAAENAKKMFDANDHVLKIIRSHMFPVNLWRVPTSREARIVSLADKLASIKELFSKKEKKDK